jgi:hypothetical protein
MFALAGRLSSLAFLLCWTGSVSAVADTLPHDAVARRAKASAVLVEAKPNYGSGFCIDASGLFVTNEHVVRQNSETVSLVLNAGLKTQQVLKARVLRRDRALDLALLQAEGEDKFEPLELGSDTELSESTELVACGFPFGPALGRPGEYPAITVNVGNVTSLRRDKDSKLHRIQLDAFFNPGNVGGPVLDRSGKVVGVVVSGIRGSGVTNAIPVSHLQRFLAQPEILLTLPTVKATNRHEAFEFTARTISVPPTAKAFDLDLVLSAGPGKEERRLPMKLVDGVYRVKAIPFPVREGPPVCSIDVRFEDGSLRGTTEDRTCRIGERKFKLTQLRSVRLGAKPEVTLENGERLEGKPAGLDSFPLKVGKQSLKMDLNGAEEVKFGVIEEVSVLLCTVRAQQRGTELARRSAALYIEGVSEPNSRADRTRELNWAAMIPDGPPAGTMLGKEFKADKVQLLNTGLDLQSGKDRIHIFLTIKPGKDVYEYNAEVPAGRGRPSIHVHMLSISPPRIAVTRTDYVMRLEFGKEKDGQTPAKLYLSFPDDPRSCIAGSFILSSE